MQFRSNDFKMLLIQDLCIYFLILESHRRLFVSHFPRDCGRLLGGVLLVPPGNKKSDIWRSGWWTSRSAYRCGTEIWWKQKHASIHESISIKYVNPSVSKIESSLDLIQLLQRNSEQLDFLFTGVIWYIYLYSSHPHLIPCPTSWLRQTEILSPPHTILRNGLVTQLFFFVKRQISHMTMDLFCGIYRVFHNLMLDSRRNCMSCLPKHLFAIAGFYWHDISTTNTRFPLTLKSVVV